MNRLNLRKRPRVCYYEPEEPPFDEYVFCTECRDYVYEYCSIHGPLLIIPDEKVPAKTGYPDFVPRAALTIPRVFLHLAKSNIEGADIGVFSTLTLPLGVRFGPYRGARAASAGDSSYAWQIYDKNHKPSHVIDARDANASNWMRYVNCSRHVSEQNLVAYQYQGQLYYRTIKVIPRFDELLVFYGSEFAATLGIELRLYSAPCECEACQARLPKKAQLKRNKRPAQIEDKPREEKILKVNPVEELQEPSILIPSDLKTNNDSTTVSASAITTEQLKAVKPKKKKNGKISSATKSESLIKSTHTIKKPVGKFQAPIIKSTNISVASVTDQNPTDTDVNLKDSKAKTLSFECDNCNKTFDVKSDLVKHIDTHTSMKNGTASQNNTESKGFKCSLSSYSSNVKSSLKLHAKTHNKDKPHKCSHCSYSCVQKQDLTRHIRTHTGKKPFTCNVCSSSFGDKSHLTQHEKTHNKDKPYKCNHCNYSCIRKHHLTSHIRTHTGEKPFTCNVCSSSFSDKRNLTTHEKTHNKDKPHKCSHCSYSCVQKQDLTRHIRTHTGEKPFTCNVCSSSFSDKSDLTRHEKTHIKDKPYKCSYCSYSCVQKQSLTIHIRTHTGEKPFTCNVCSSSFSDKRNLTTHEKTHNKDKPHKCSHCSYSCVQKQDLTRHIRTHTGEKPYTCDICDYRSVRLEQLKCHLLGTHGGVKPHSCSVCSYRCVTKSNLKVHLKRHNVHS